MSSPGELHGGRWRADDRQPRLRPPAATPGQQGPTGRRSGNPAASNAKGPKSSPRNNKGRPPNPLRLDGVVAPYLRTCNANPLLAPPSVGLSRRGASPPARSSACPAPAPRDRSRAGSRGRTASSSGRLSRGPSSPPDPRPSSDAPGPPRARSHPPPDPASCPQAAPRHFKRPAAARSIPDRAYHARVARPMNPLLVPPSAGCPVWSGLTLLDPLRPNEGWASWENRSAVAGRPAGKPRRLGLDSYADVLEAAAGNGIALGWRRYVERSLEAGTLVALGDGVSRVQRHPLRRAHREGTPQAARPQVARLLRPGLNRLLREGIATRHAPRAR